MPQDDDFMRLVGDDGPSREDSLNRFIELNTMVSRDLGDAAQLLLEIAKEKPLTMEEMMQIAESYMLVRANYRLVRTILQERIPSAYLSHLNEHGKDKES